MKKILLVLGLLVGMTSIANAQCDFETKIHFNPTHMDVSDNASYWFTGVKFVAYDVSGRLVGRSPMPSPSPAVRPSYFPLHVYGDDPMTDSVEGPREGECIFVSSNIMKNCEMLITDSLITFHNWVNVNVHFRHPGDINNNGVIDIFDYKLVVNAFVQQKNHDIYTCKADVNGDGVVNDMDVSMIGRIALWNDPKSTIGLWDYACNN